MGASSSSERESSHQRLPGSFDATDTTEILTLAMTRGTPKQQNSTPAPVHPTSQTQPPMPAAAHGNAPLGLPNMTEPPDIKYVSSCICIIIKLTDCRPDDVVIAVMGVTGSGKTTFVNYFADVELEIGHGLEPCKYNSENSFDLDFCVLRMLLGTQIVQVVPCTLENGQSMWLVDTPGFDDTYRTDAEILREIANWLNTAYKMQIKLTGIIYLHRILDVRVGGAGVKNLRMFKRLCGDNGLGSVVLATTMWSYVPDEATGQRRERELSTEPIFWKHMIEHGSQVFRQDKGRKSGTEIVKYLINKRRPVTLDIQREMVDQRRQLLETGAGAEVATQVEKNSQMWEKKLEEIRKELQDAIAQRDHDAREELVGYKEVVEQKIRKDQDEIRKMQTDSDQLFQQMKEAHEQDVKKWADLIQEKDKMIEEARSEANQLRQKNEYDLELEKYKMQMQLKERYYKMVYATRCVVM